MLVKLGVSNFHKRIFGETPIKKKLKKILVFKFACLAKNFVNKTSGITIHNSIHFILNVSES